MTYDEEVTWWETHDVSEYKDEFTEAEAIVEPGALNAPKHLKELSRKLVALNLESSLNIRLSKRDHNNLRLVARQKGIGIATLARMWIIENLQTVKRNQPQTLLK